MYQIELQAESFLVERGKSINISTEQEHGKRRKGQGKKLGWTAPFLSSHLQEFGFPFVRNLRDIAQENDLGKFAF